MSTGRRYRRREFVAAGIAGAGFLSLGPAFWRALAASPSAPGAGPYGPLQSPDANGLMLPQGFSSRVVARSNQPVPDTNYVWHVFPDGQATYAIPDGGWILVSNSESLAGSGGGASAIRFAPNASIAGAYRILGGTDANCAGGRTPWGTWLSCEEHAGGRVWECYPGGSSTPVVRPAMGVFKHEAGAVDPIDRRVYMTEDRPDGGLYRFTPLSYPDLSAGLLEVAVVSGGDAVSWAAVPDPSAISGDTRYQVAGMAKFAGGEGMWFDSGFVYFTTKHDDRVYSYDTAGSKLDVVYDRSLVANAPLTGLDNITAAPSGDLYVCEDGGDMEIGVLAPDDPVRPRRWTVARFCKLTGTDHSGSELAGVAFDPSGSRMYFASQRGFGSGAIYEVSGPFRPPPGGLLTGTHGAPPAASAPAGPSPPPGYAHDAQLRVVAPPRVSLRRLSRTGLTVVVRGHELTAIELVLRTPDLASEPGERGSTDRPVPRTVASGSLERLNRGSKTARLRPVRGLPDPLRRRTHRALRATLTAQGLRTDGRPVIASSPLRLF